MVTWERSPVSGSRVSSTPAASAGTMAWTTTPMATSSSGTPSRAR